MRTFPNGDAVFAAVDAEEPTRAVLTRVDADLGTEDLTPARRQPLLPVTLLWAHTDEVGYAEDGWFRASDLRGEPIDLTFGEADPQATGGAPYPASAGAEAPAGWFFSTEEGELLEVARADRPGTPAGVVASWMPAHDTGGGRAALARSTRAEDCRVVYAWTQAGLRELRPRADVTP